MNTQQNRRSEPHKPPSAVEAVPRSSKCLLHDIAGSLQFYLVAYFDSSYSIVFTGKTAFPAKLRFVLEPELYN